MGKVILAFDVMFMLLKAVIEIWDYVTEHNGGDGAVREFIEWLILY